MLSATSASTHLAAETLGPFGAAVHGVPDWSRPSDELVHEMTILLRRHLVLAVRGLPIPTHGDLETFLEPFGTLISHKQESKEYWSTFDTKDDSVFQKGGFQKIDNKLYISNIGMAEDAAEQHWHHDTPYRTYLKVIGCLVGIDVGPDAVPTNFRDVYTAYEMLPRSARAELEDKLIIYWDHSVSAPPRQADTMYPILMAHPHSGRRTIFLSGQSSARSIAGMDEELSTYWINYLYDHIDRNALRYDHKWHTGDVLLWDNIGLNHRETADGPSFGHG